MLFRVYEEINQEVNRRPIYEYRCDVRLKDRDEGSARLTYTGLCKELEHLKIEEKLIIERFASVMGECDLESIGVSLIFKTIRSAAVLISNVDKLRFES